MHAGERFNRSKRLINKADLVPDPCCNEGKTCDRSRRRVDDVGKFLPRYFEVIRQRPCRVAYDQCVAVVVEENHQSHQPDCDLAANSGLRATHYTLHDARHSAVPRDDADHAANHHRKQNNRRTIGVGHRPGDVHLETVEQALPGSRYSEGLQRRRSQPQTEQQRRNDVAQQQRNSDCHECGQHRYPARNDAQFRLRSIVARRCRNTCRATIVDHNGVKQRATIVVRSSAVTLAAHGQVHQLTCGGPGHRNVYWYCGKANGRGFDLDCVRCERQDGRNQTCKN